MTDLSELPEALQEEAIITARGFEGDLPPPDKQDAEFYRKVHSQNQIDSDD